MAAIVRVDFVDLRVRRAAVRATTDHRVHVGAFAMAHRAVAPAVPIVLRVVGVALVTALRVVAQRLVTVRRAVVPHLATAPVVAPRLETNGRDHRAARRVAKTWAGRALLKVMIAARAIRERSASHVSGLIAAIV